MPAISEGSPPPRCWSPVRNQFQHFAWLAPLLFRQEIHPGAGREIVRRLGAAMKHDHQRKRLSLRAAWDEKLVGPASGRVAEGASDEPRALGYDIRRGGRSARDRTTPAQPGELTHAIERRGAFASLNRGGLRGLPAFPLLDEVSLSVDGRRLEPCGRRAGSAAGRRFWGALATEHALQERGGDSASHHLVLSARAALTAGVAWKAPSTETEAMVARASSGVTSWAMVARPRTLMCSISPARCAASRSSRL